MIVAPCHHATLAWFADLRLLRAAVGFMRARIVASAAAGPESGFGIGKSGWKRWTRAGRQIGIGLFLGLAVAFLPPARAAEPAASSETSPAALFESANKAYERGQYEEAASLYEKMVGMGFVSPALYMNLGNAWFKAGHLGRALAGYRLGLRLNPRDPGLRFNLRFTREQVATGQPESSSWLERALTRLTVNEWTALGLAFYWVWFGLLAAGEWRAEWRRSLRGYTATAGAVVTLMVGCVLGAVRYWNTHDEAVVVSPEAVVRYGPLDESQEYFQMRDGQEVRVLQREQKEGVWLNIRDPSGREGWVREEALMRLAPVMAP